MTPHGLIFAVFSDLEMAVEMNARQHNASLREAFFGLGEATPTRLDAVLRGLVDGRVRSAAVLADLPGPEEQWVVYEWWGSLVVEVDVEITWPHEHPGWDQQLFDGVRQLVVFKPPVAPAPANGPTFQVESISEFRAALDGNLAAAIEMPYRPGLAEDQALFGSYAEPRVGGAVALLMLSDAQPGDRRVRLRSPAALGLTVIDPADSVYNHRREGRIRATSRGLSGARNSMSAFQDFELPEVLYKKYQALRSDYVVALELEALVDPTIVIPVGQVFEQHDVCSVQTLAVRQPVSVLVTPGRLEPLVLPAWCLNNRLAGPSGEPMRATPFRVNYPSEATQSEVWDDRARVLSS